MLTSQCERRAVIAKDLGGKIGVTHANRRDSSRPKGEAGVKANPHRGRTGSGNGGAQNDMSLLGDLKALRYKRGHSRVGRGTPRLQEPDWERITVD